mmetsp:Transcript_29158/g.45686  ORF Transcript_29158/g.45686 Transcript_29158/m.45686 type:complete len:227 (+) Transcript_29158:1200-1880(+)
MERPGAFSALTQLSLRQNPMGLECASNIASWLRKCSDLRVVDLAATAIGPGAEFVIEGLVGCPTLSSLNLEDNRIGWETAARVGSMLKVCTNLRTLSLARNDLRCEGIGGISEGLAKCVSLQCLQLGENAIADRGVEILVRVLVKLPLLTELGLASNRICNDGAFNLAMGLDRCPALSCLELCQNHVKSEGQKALQERAKLRGFGAASVNLRITNQSKPNLPRLNS